MKKTLIRYFTPRERKKAWAVTGKSTEQSSRDINRGESLPYTAREKKHVLKQNPAMDMPFVRHTTSHRTMPNYAKSFTFLRPLILSLSSFHLRVYIDYANLFSLVVIPFSFWGCIYVTIYSAGGPSCIFQVHKNVIRLFLALPISECLQRGKPCVFN